MMGHGKCYGSTVMGERGQVVIPVEAREELSIVPGEKLIVFGHPERGVIIIFKSDIMARFAEMMLRKASFFEEVFRGPHKPGGQEFDKTDESQHDQGENYSD